MSAQPRATSPGVHGERPNERRAALVEWLVDNLALKLAVVPASIELDTPFQEYGLDSVDAIDIAGKLGRLLELTTWPTSATPGARRERGHARPRDPSRASQSRWWG
jgi:acyl carrier protein